ncbi:TetR/AcrR family transcriptional regulator [Paenibacillus antri]|uniref:TetR/AcrR family transcriptional regulator n=1 Tax=Paenibacillus antri TaxID=2582848 RepID=A0A5R9G3E5_9BACL|nr:TetR/AcrR family transcriptional regulator [Paenibacillus antri]TLS50882.1 TetR/AcrR family transcriptional regulator [Paenibacillus antri]
MVRNEPDELARKITETAQALFHERGIENVSMHQIAKSAGIGQGTLYRRFPSKSKLCLCLMESKFERFMREAESGLLAAREEPVVRRLSALMTKVIELVYEDMEWVMAVIAAERLEVAKTNLFELPPFLFLSDQVRRLLEEAADGGESVPLEPDFAAVVIASIPRADLLLHLRDRGYSSEQIADRFCRTFIDPLFGKMQP